jgi:peptidoglycan hydrolase CwlO-like protein
MDAARPNSSCAKHDGARRSVACVLALTLTALLWSPIASRGDLQSQVGTQSITAQQLQAAISAETGKIEATSAGVTRAEARLVQLQSQAQARQTQLIAVQQRLVRARGRLTRLVNRMHLATRLLAQNLIAAYKSDRPDVTTVVLESQGFSDLLERLDFAQRVGKQDARILADTRRARTDVLRQTTELQRIEARMQALTAQVVQARNEAAAVHGALLNRQVALINARANSRAKLKRVQGQISSLRAQIAHVQQQALAAPGTGGQHIAVNAGGMAQASSGAPAAVAQVIAAGNAIAGLPYVYGGGHASFHANAYDCSGSVSYALAAAGLVSSPLTSTGFESWGEPGPGKWITVYANAGHAFMIVDNWRFDTGALSGDGTRFTRAMRSTAGFVARHPPGL